MGIDAFLGPDAQFASLLSDYVPVGAVREDPKSEEERRLENALRAVAEVPHRVTVRPSQPAAPDDHRRHSLDVTTAKLYPVPDGWDATIELLTRPGEARHVAGRQPLKETFTIADVADITPFLAVRLRTDNGLEMGTVVVAELIGDVADRLDTVIARQIDTPEKFLRFLHLILSLGNLPPGPTHEPAARRAAGGIGLATGRCSRAVLRALADDPGPRRPGRLVATAPGHGARARFLPDGSDTLWKAAREAPRAPGEDTVSPLRAEPSWKT